MNLAAKLSIAGLTTLAAVLLLGELASIAAIATRTDRLYWDAHAVTHFFCHQLPSRCPWFDGMPTVLCFRCVGIYSGILVGPALLWPYARHWSRRAIALMMIAVVPSLVELLVDRFFNPSVSAFFRWSTGVTLGLGMTALLSLLAEKQFGQQALGRTTA